jgi:hypothetical protein
VGGKHPPFLIVYADKDFSGCAQQSERMAAALRKCQCEAPTLEIKDRTHITIIVSMARPDDPATQALLGFIAKHSDWKPAADKPATP